MLGSKMEVPASCPTGNCTWPVTTSLAICGNCSSASFAAPTCNDTDCTYTISDRATATLTNFTGRNDFGVGFRLIPSTGSAYNSLLKDKAYISNFFTMGYGYKVPGSKATPDSLKAYECALWWCVNAYQTQAALPISEVVYTADSLNVSSVPDDLFYNYTFPAIDDGLMRKYNISPASASINYSVQYVSMVTLQQYMNKTMDGFATLNQAVGEVSSDITDGIWYAASSLDDMQTWIGRVTQSLSDYVRLPWPRSSKPVVLAEDRPFFAGSATMPGYVVRWRWLALPVLLVVVSMQLLLAVMVMSARSRVGLWKGNNWLMYLFTDMDPSIKWRVDGRRLTVGSLGSPADGSVAGGCDVAQFVKDVKVVLDHSEQGEWAFREVRD